MYQHIQFKTSFFVPTHSVQNDFFLYQHTQFKTSALDFDFQAAGETPCFKLFTALNCGGSLAEGRVERRRLKYEAHDAREVSAIDRRETVVVARMMQAVGLPPSHSQLGR